VTLETDIRPRLDDVVARVRRAARRAGREPGSVRLVAVSKTFDAPHVRAAAAAGQLEFGENRVQEALPKMAALADLRLTWHLVGHLQANKARKAASAFHVVHSIDRLDLLARLEETCGAGGRRIEGLVQVDLAGEVAKHGAPPGQLQAIFEAAAGCRFVAVRGLMVLPPFFDDPEDARPYFRRLRTLRDGLAGSGVPQAMLAELSMGMSHDFEVAIEEGATMVRVGTAIFGSRTP
jgi:pyridoxal phosphate enzyme (YggS family)